MAELADVAGLKTRGRKAWGFESLPRHQHAGLERRRAAVLDAPEA